MRPILAVRSGAMPRLTKLSRSIAGKVAIVTGAASGMGRATAQLFADEGAVVAAVDRDGAVVKGVADEVTAAGGKATAFELDVSDPDAINAVVDDISTGLGPVDILVNNAGVSI